MTSPTLISEVPEHVSDDFPLVPDEILELQNVRLTPFPRLAQGEDVVHNVLANHLTEHLFTDMVREAGPRLRDPAY